MACETPKDLIQQYLLSAQNGGSEALLSALLSINCADGFAGGGTGPTGPAGPTGATGATGTAAPCFPNVPDVVSLHTLDVSLFCEGQQVFVESLQDYWSYRTNAGGLTPDDITVSITSAGGNTRFERMLIMSQGWLYQPQWYIDGLTGNDENDGSLVTPLGSVAELLRRVTGGSGVWSPPGNVIVTFLTDTAFFDGFSVKVIPNAFAPSGGSPQTSVVFEGIATDVETRDVATSTLNSPVGNVVNNITTVPAMAGADVRSRFIDNVTGFYYWVVQVAAGVGYITYAADTDGFFSDVDVPTVAEGAITFQTFPTIFVNYIDGSSQASANDPGSGYGNLIFRNLNVVFGAGLGVGGDVQEGTAIGVLFENCYVTDRFPEILTDAVAAINCVFNSCWCYSIGFQDGCSVVGGVIDKCTVSKGGACYANGPFFTRNPEIDPGPMMWVEANGTLFFGNKSPVRNSTTVMILVDSGGTVQMGDNIFGVGINNAIYGTLTNGYVFQMLTDANVYYSGATFCTIAGNQILWGLAGTTATPKLPAAGGLVPAAAACSTFAQLFAAPFTGNAHNVDNLAKIWTQANPF